MRSLIKKIKNDFIYISVRLLLFLFKISPGVLNRLFLRFIVLLAMRLPIRENRIARVNLGLYFAKRDAERIFREMYLHWARCIEELIEVQLKGRDIEHLAIISDESRRVLNQALKEKRGVIYFTAHLGNWELMALTLAKEGYDINTIANRSYDPRFTEMIKRFREGNKVKCIFRGEEQIVEKIKAVLSRNAIMGFLIDQNTKVPSIMVNFIGRAAPTPITPVKILKETNAVPVVGFNHRINNKVITEVRRVEFSGDEDEKLILERINDILSQEIMKFPCEWIWIHNRWNISC
ncbi:MAG: lysophospholipid acyltransferase family protein [Myxococcota bacterium]